MSTADHPHESSLRRLGRHGQTLLWFLRDAVRLSPKASATAIGTEFAYYFIQASAYGLLLAALSDPDRLLSSLDRTVAAVVLSVGLALALVAGEVMKYVGQRSKYRIAFDYELDALSRVLRYGHRANRFDRETIKNLVSRSPQVSARVAMASVDAVVPTIVGLIAATFMLITHPFFTIWLAVGLVLVLPLYFAVVKRGRQATQQFYSPAGLNYARDAVLFFSPGRGGVSPDGVERISAAARPSLKALEVRRSTPNLMYLVTGTAMSVTLAGLVGYSIVLATSEDDASQSLLQIFFILRFLYSGVGGLSGAISKTHILLPRVEPVLWALRGEPPPPVLQAAALAPIGELFEDDLDD